MIPHEQHSHSEQGRSSSGRSGILRRALEAADAGMSVFPLHHKIPAIPKEKGGRGHLDASGDSSRIHAMFNAAGHRVTGYGVRTGSASQIIVVDIDSEEGVREARQMGLGTTGYIVRTGREEPGWHLYYSIPKNLEVKGGPFGEHLRLQGDGQYVAGPGSRHPSGRPYIVARNGPMSPAPPELLRKAQEERRTRTRNRGRPTSMDTKGGPIPDGERNDTLVRICGRLHDGSRDLDTLIGDLDEINQARCSPPLPLVEVEKIGKSIFSRKPCNPSPEVSEWVKKSVARLSRIKRPIKGMGGSSGWAIYSALLEHAARHGKQHDGEIAVSVDRRTIAQAAGTNHSTVTRWIRKTPLVSVGKRGSGRRSSILLLHVPESEAHEGHSLHHSSTRGDWLENETSRSGATNALRRSLYRMRWSGGAAKGRPGLSPKTRKVRQSRPVAWDAIRRVGKSKAAIVWAVVECVPGEMSRAAIAERLGRKAASLREPLRFLVEAGLLIRVRRGYYAVPDDLAARLEDARELGREPEQDRLQIRRHALARDGYHNRDKEPESEAREPSEEGLQNVRRSRQKREEYFRQEAEERERRASEAESEEKRAYREQKRRVDRLVYEGMGRRQAWAEVRGEDPFD